MVIPLKVGFSPELLVQPLNPISGSLQSRGDEVTDWKFVDGGRSHLRWRFRGRLREWLTPYELRALSKGDV